MNEEIKIKIENKISELKSRAQVNDTVINLLSKDPIIDYSFNSGLRILPLELTEKFGIIILQDEKVYKKHFRQEYDVFYQDWKIQLEKYWEDRLKLIEEYTKPAEQLVSPFETYNKLAELMVKIERRIILLKSEAKPVIQKHPRLSGDQREYSVLRSYWITDSGEAKRLISRHIGDRYENLEKEIANLFYERGFAVQRQYKSETSRYDLVIERDKMKSAVEIKLVTKEIFNNLFLFNELLKKFKEDYPLD